MGQSCSPSSQSQSKFPPSICQALTLSAAVPLCVQEQSRSLSFPTYFWYWDKGALFLESKLEQNECINVQYSRDWAYVSLELGNNAWSGICLQMSQPFSTLLKPLSCSVPTQLQDVTHLESWEGGKNPRLKHIFASPRKERKGEMRLEGINLEISSETLEIGGTSAVFLSSPALRTPVPIVFLLRKRVL